MDNMCGNLVAGDETTRAAAWEAIFMDVDRVRELLAAAPKDKLAEVLTVGQAWAGSPAWTITRTAKAVRECTGLTIVEDDFKQYLAAFLYSVALAGGIDVQGLAPNPRMVELLSSGSTAG